MPKRLPIAYDASDAAQPESSKYTKAMLKRAMKTTYLQRVGYKSMVLNAVCLLITGITLWDNRNMAADLIEIAKTRPVHLVEPGEDGHYRVTMINGTISVSQGARLNAAEWFGTWMRRITRDPVAMKQDQIAGRARLVNESWNKWDALIKADLKVSEGYTRDVTEMRSTEASFDPKTRIGTTTLVWRELTWKKGGKPTPDKLADRVMTMQVVTRDDGPREGAWDGVNIVDFTAPLAIPDPAAQQVSEGDKKLSPG